MRRPLLALTAAVTAALLVAPSASAARPPATGDDAQTVVLPGRAGTEPLSPVEGRWRASAHGIAAQLATEELAPRRFYALASDPTPVELSDTGSADVAVGPDGVVVGAVGYDDVTGGDYRLIDPRTGTRRTFRAKGFLAAPARGGVVSTLNDARGFEVRFTPYDGPGRTLLLVPPQQQVPSAAYDEAGAVLAVRTADQTAVEVVAVDLDGTSRTLARYPRSDREPLPVLNLAVSPGAVAFSTRGPDGAAVVVLRRDGTGSPQVRPVRSVDRVAVRDDSVAWFGSDGGDFLLHTAPHDPQQPATAFAARYYISSYELQSGPGGYVVPQATGAPVVGFGLVRPGATSVEPLLRAPLAPAELFDLQLDDARVAVDDEVLDGDLAVRDVEPDGRVGEERLQRAGDDVVVQRLSGARTVSLRVQPDGSGALVVEEAGRELRRVPVADDLQDVALSGRRLLVSTGNDAGTTGTSRLVDVPSGVTLDLPRGAALWGPYAVYVDASGTVVRRDLDRPGSPLVVVRRQVPRTSLLQIDGDDVLVDTLDGSPGSVSVHRVSSRGVASRTLTDSARDEVVLGHGVLARLQGTSLGLAAVSELVAGGGGFTSTSTSAGEVLPVVDDDVVTWQGGDGRVRVRPLPFALARAPRVLSVDAAAGTTGAWTFSAEADEALRSWSLELRDARGDVVARRSALPRSGSVRAAWDGRRADGSAAPDGVYRWTLTGTDLEGDGVLATADGTGPPSGTVAVRRAAPVVSALSAPVVSTQESAGRSFPVRWSAAAGLRIDLRYAEVVGGVAGTPRPWLSGTAARSAVFGVTGAPRVADGKTYRITAVARDELGRTSAARTVTTVVPYDDRSSAVRYAGAWTSASASGRYAGTLRTSSARGATATLQGSGRSLRVVADRCAACGKVAVVLDGRTVATVDTRASATRSRQVVWSRSFPSTGRHVLQLRVLSGRVALDGVALGQQ